MQNVRFNYAIPLLTIVLWSSVLSSSVAAPMSSFTPPTNVTVRMYKLLSGGDSTGILCSTNDTSYGCTAFCYGSPKCEGSQIIGYPYGQNPASVPIETDYLLDVVPSEISVEAFHPTAIQAQAIAARSYAYCAIGANEGGQGYPAACKKEINNSSGFQVFVPYAFEVLPSATFPDNPSDPCVSTNLNNDQRIVCNAVAPRHYISYGAYPSDDLPAFTEYFGDIRNRTVSGGQPYLIAVDDPISSHPDIVNDGHGHGMSQKGASRWARGNLSYNINQDLGAWSVVWARAEQILVHYYTGIHVREASGASLTPDYRWNPLKLTWSGSCPPLMFHGQSCAVTVQVQNTGTSDWTCGQYTGYVLSYGWAKAGYGEVNGASQVSLCGVSQGDPSPMATLSIGDIPNWGSGAYTLRLDMARTVANSKVWFSNYPHGWPSYDMGVCVDGSCKVFLPQLIR